MIDLASALTYIDQLKSENERLRSAARNMISALSACLSTPPRVQVARDDLAEALNRK